MNRQRKGLRPYRVRLSIAIPALVVLITVGYGQVCRALVEQNIGGVEEMVPRERLFALLHYLELMIYAGGVVSGVFGVLLARVITKPLSRMSEEFDVLAQQGRARSLSNPRGDEIGQLYKSFNRMVNSITRFLPERARYIFHNVASGILTIDSNGILTNINSAADQTLELGGVGINDQGCEEFLRRFGDMTELTAVLREAWEEGKSAEAKTVHVRTISGTPKTLVLSTSPTPAEDDSGHEVVATLMDLGSMEKISARILHEDKLSMVGRLASGVAHEIRNPMTSLRGTAQLLREDIGGADNESRKYLDIMLEEIDRLDRVVGQLLDFAKPSADQCKPVRLADVIHRGVGLVRTRLRIRRISLTLQIDDPTLQCLVVPDKILQILLNLLMNACEATPEGGKIRVESCKVAEGVRLSVHNSGSYISPEDQAHIFEPFYTTKSGGTGLGLAVSYQIVAGHGGRMTVQSDADEGTTFHCVLPAAIPVEEEPLLVG